MLDSHSQISSPDEFDFLFEPFGNDVSSEEIRDFNLGRFIQSLEDNPSLKQYGLKFSNSANCQTLIHQIVLKFWKAEKLLVLHIHRNFVIARTIFPTAKFIHLIRDPRDCAISAMGMGWAGNPYFGVEPWIEAELSWDRVSAQLSEKDFIETRFENIVRHPVSELTRICDFLGLPYDPRMLDFEHPNYKRPDPQYAEKWRRVLAPREICMVEGRVATLMRKRGYATTNLPPLSPNLLHRTALAVQNKLRKNAFAIRRFGLKLWAIEKISRWLKLGGLWRRQKAKMFEINVLYLK
jgi:hypothetical protein